MHRANGRQALHTIGKKAVRAADSIVNLAVLSAVLALFAYGCYGLWDTGQIYKNAGTKKFGAYKPTDKDGLLSFGELEKRNPDVLGWLTVYGTGIDYPLVQGADNQKYLHTDAKGEYSYSGSLFLDARNSRDFSDYNTIIYGHHMEKEAMFGDIGRFKEPGFFAGHRYGNLYYGGKDHGVEFFAFLDANAYDTVVFHPGVKGQGAQAAYLRLLSDAAVNTRDVGIGIGDRLVVLSTCTLGTTDGRNLLAGRITGQAYPDPFQKKPDQVDAQRPSWERLGQALGRAFGRIPIWARCVAGLMAAMLGALAVIRLLAAVRASRRKGL